MSDIATVIPNSSQALDQVLANPTNTGAERSTQKTLGQAEFFKLLTTQLASQDPLKPMDDTAFIAQMANFSELEMTSQLTSNFEEFTTLQRFQTSQAYIGKHVSLQSEDGEVSGLATGIEDDKGVTRIFVDGKGYNIDSVFKVELPLG